MGYVKICRGRVVNMETTIYGFGFKVYGVRVREWKRDQKHGYIGNTGVIQRITGIHADHVCCVAIGFSKH